MDHLERLLTKYPNVQVTDITHKVDAQTFAHQKSQLERKKSTGGAIGLVHLNDGTVVLTKRSGLHAGWALIGGTVENNEEFDAAFIRETLEESGLTITIDRLALIERKLFISPGGEQLTMLLAVFEAHARPGQKIIATQDAIDEGLEVQAFKISNLPEKMILKDREKIEQLSRNREHHDQQT